MISANDLIEDSRFYIDEWNARRILAIPAKKYSIERISVGDIYRELAGNFYNLQETDVYKYINGDSEAHKRYREYCETFCKGNDNRGEKQFDELIEKLRQNGYSLTKGAIVINQFNAVQEGQHRACVLMALYGPDYKIDVVKLYYKGLQIKRRVRLLLWKHKHRM